MKICAVIVTYNRYNKLVKTLSAFDNQIIFPDKVFVVNNHSTDKTYSFLEKWAITNDKYTKEVINLRANLGGSGGFYAGLMEAVKQGYDWIWVSDDDAYPATDAFQQVHHYLRSNNSNQLAAICGMVFYEKGIDYSHRRNMYSEGLKVLDIQSTKEDYKKEEFEINVFSYVGTVLNREAIELMGYPKKDYFIWCDDTEHSLRLSKYGKIMCVPSIKIFHDIGVSTVYGLSWKDYYGERNKLEMYKSNFSKPIFMWQIMRSNLRVIKYLITGDFQKAKLLYAAISDFKKGKFGIHPIYKPGWKPKE